MLYFSNLEQLVAHKPTAIPYLAGYLSSPALVELDGLSWLIIWIVASTSILLTLSTIGTRKFVTFTILAAAFVSCTILLTAINNILLFFALWELAATICWAIAKSSLRTFNTVLGPLATSWIGSLGSVAMLVMVILLIIQSGTLSTADLNTTTPGLVATLLVVGISLKSLGILSAAWFHSRERVFASANAFLAALGIIVVGLYPYIKITRVVLDSQSGWKDGVIWAALAVTLLFAFAGLRERDLYRICSYTAFGQFFIFIASFTVNNQYALQGALLGLIGYIAGIISLFLVAGLVNQANGSRFVRQEQALISQQPTLAVLFLVSAMSLIGLPPLVGFATKALLTMGLFERNQLYSILWIGIWSVSAISILRAFQLTFVSVPKLQAGRVVPRATLNWPTLIPIGIAVAFLLSASFWQQDILLWLKPVMMIMSG